MKVFYIKFNKYLKKYNNLIKNNVKILENDEKVQSKVKYLFPKQIGIDMGKIQVTNISLYSITPHYMSKNMISKMKQYINKYSNIILEEAIITDANANVGGDSISFSKYFDKVQSIEMNHLTYEALVNNICLYNLSNVHTYLGDCIEIIPKIKQDIIYFDPPWGGPRYKNKDKVMLYLSNIPIYKVVNKFKENCDIIFLKVPLNFNWLDFIKNTKKFKYIRKYEIYSKYFLICMVC